MDLAGPSHEHGILKIQPDPTTLKRLVFHIGIPLCNSKAMGILRTDSLSRSFPRGQTKVEALRNVSLSIGDGEFVTITGPRGSGKSTLLQLLGLLDRPTAGELFVDDVDADAMTDDERSRHRRTRFGVVFQSFQLLPGLSAWENVALPKLLDGERLGSLQSKALELLAEVGLADRAQHRPAELSGGEQQRVAIARSLIANPSFVFADEPTGALDQKASAAVVDLLRRLTVDNSRTLILVTHDPTIAASRGARNIALLDGAVVADSGAERSARS